jgi:hypothetical protein
MKQEKNSVGFKLDRYTGYGFSWSGYVGGGCMNSEWISAHRHFDEAS